MKHVAIVGGGSWGTALSIMAARGGNEVRLWSRNPGVVESVNRDRVNHTYLPQASIPSGVRASSDAADVVNEAELVVLAAPSHATRAVLKMLSSATTPGTIFVSATKGVEVETGLRMSQVLESELGKRTFVCLSGPSFAREVAEKHPTAIVAASDDLEASRLVQARFSVGSLRIYTNRDVVGTELGGSLKNVMAIASGMVAGLNLGANSVAALITRGLAEISRLALQEGAMHETMMGLAGLGDLVLTCTGALSRNRFVGFELGKGRDLKDILDSMNEVAEGVKTTKAIKELAARAGVDMPITNEVHKVLYEGKTAREAAVQLMTRPLRDEFESPAAT
jgi:glycerol-3-phosphate dehydrogenase (NAD(P)+)